jgi:hypothetical protein
MNRSIRSLLAASALLIGSLAFAQPGPYPITISGQVIPCDPANNYVTITTILNTLPDLDIEVPLDSNCTYSVTVMMDDLQGSFQVGAACSGAMAYGTGSYQVNIDSANAASVVIYVTCGSNPDPCQACVSVVQDSSFFGIVPFSATFHSCSSGGTAPYTYVWQLPDGSTLGYRDLPIPVPRSWFLQRLLDDGGCDRLHQRYLRLRVRGCQWADQLQHRF